MFSFGIQFGQGFDRQSIHKMMQSVPAEFDYDFLVIGSSPGGVACAREASLAGKKTAIVKWRSYSTAEEEGISENLEDMANTLGMSEENSNLENEGNSDNWDLVSPKIAKHSRTNFSTKSSSIASKSGMFASTQWPRDKSKYASRKVRQSRLDLINELFKRGQQCRKLMRTASNLGEAIMEAEKYGWRVVTTSPTLSINWNKMTEAIMDFVMEENWKLMSALSEERVEIIEGGVTFVDNHTVKVKLSEMGDHTTITAHTICLAPSADYVFPEDVTGAECFGINCDDFYRMSDPPGKTLIVGSIPEAMECAGIVANCRFPVTVVSRSKILKGYDSEISQMIVNDLKKKGVVFLEETTLTGIDVLEDGTEITVNFSFNQNAGNTLQKPADLVKQRFDTVIFAVGKRVSFDSLNVKLLGITLDPIMQKIRADRLDATSVPNIYAIGDAVADRPGGSAISELAGKLLGKRLFNNGTEITDYSFLPCLILTPTEYAFVGLSEDAASYRLGAECVSVHYGSFKPLDFVISRKNGECFAKVIVFKPKDTIIGLHFYGPEAGEMIQGFAAALKTGFTMTQLQTLAGVPTTKAQELLKLKNLRSHPSTD